MASSCPGALDNLGGMETHEHIADAVDAVQAELGADPAGTAETVSARFDGIQAGTSVTGTRGTGDSDILAALLTVLDAAGIISDDTTGA